MKAFSVYLAQLNRHVSNNKVDVIKHKRSRWMKHLNNGGETPIKALNKIVSKDKQQLHKTRANKSQSEQSSKSKSKA